MRGPATTRFRALASWSVALVALVSAVPVLVLGAPFWLVAWLTRRLPRLLPLEPPSLDWPSLLQYEPVVGWRPRGNLRAFGQADDVFRLSTDEEGWRGSVPLDEADVLAFGDSFAFGHGVDDEAIYAEQVPDVKVKAIGSDGYSMVHGLLWMRHLGQRLAGKLVVWFVYTGNDLHDNLRPNVHKWRMPFVRWDGGGWHIASDHVSPEYWPLAPRPRYMAALAEYCCDTPESRRAYGAAGFLIEEAQRTCRQAGARLSVVVVPRRTQIDPRLVGRLRDQAPDLTTFDPLRPDHELRRACDSAGVPAVALSDVLEPADYQMRDIHWNGRGHRKVARLIERLHHEHHPREVELERS